MLGVGRAKEEMEIKESTMRKTLRLVRYREALMWLFIFATALTIALLITRTLLGAGI